MSWCDLRKMKPVHDWQYPVQTGAKRKRVRCPMCGRRLTLQTVPDRQDGGVAFYRIPQHKVKSEHT